MDRWVIVTVTCIDTDGNQYKIERVKIVFDDSITRALDRLYPEWEEYHVWTDSESDK